MKTSSEILKEHLLKGGSIHKFQFMNMTPTHTVCLAQRVEELRRAGWVIKDRPVEGKGNLKTYYMEQAEIDRIKNTQYMPISKQIETDEQSVDVDTNIAPGGLEMAQNEFYEQLGLGLLGTSNY